MVSTASVFHHLQSALSFVASCWKQRWCLQCLTMMLHCALCQPSEVKLFWHELNVIIKSKDANEVAHTIRRDAIRQIISTYILKQLTSQHIQSSFHLGSAHNNCKWHQKWMHWGKAADAMRKDAKRKIAQRMQDHQHLRHNGCGWHHLPDHTEARTMMILLIKLLLKLLKEMQREMFSRTMIWSSVSTSQLLWMTSHARLQAAQRRRWTGCVESMDGMRRDGKNIAWSWPSTQLTALTAQHILQPTKWSHWGKDNDDAQPLEDDKDGPMQEEPPAAGFIMIM